MPIVILADFAVPSGGSEAVAIASAVALAARGSPVVYVQGVSGDVDPRLPASGVSVVSLGLQDVWARPSAKAAASGIWNGEAARRLAGVLGGLSAGPTVLHLHQWTRAMSPSVLPVCLRSGHPVAITLHDYFLACPNGVYYRFERGEPCGERPLSPSCLLARCDPRSSAHKLVRVLRTAATRAAIRSAGFDVVHVSDRGRRTIEPFLPAGLAHHRIDNPVDALPGPPAEIAADAPVAYVGRLTREKGADLLAEAGRAAGIPLVFIGEGPASAEVRRLAPDALQTGWLPKAEVARRLSAGEIRAVVAPSRWYETGPLTVYEALAAGVPAVASDRAGASEAIADGKTGFVTAADPAGLAAALAALRDPARVSTLGRAAHAAYWSAPRSPDVHADRLLALYGAMAARRAGDDGTNASPFGPT